MEKRIKRASIVSCAVLLAACGGSGGGSLVTGTPLPPVQTPDARTPSVSRAWNEVMLDAIRNDFDRPTTYRDASDQCSLSRIWGGIHPPADDIPGRIIGEQIGIRAFGLADTLINSGR